MEMSSLSLEYVPVGVSFQVGLSVMDPTSDPVWLAFTPQFVDAAPSDWIAATWLPGGPPFSAAVLVGPGSSHVLAKGQYWIWIKISDNPEEPVRVAGFLAVT